MLEIKILMASLLRQYKFVKCDQTEVDFIYFVLYYKDTFYLIKIILKEKIKLDRQSPLTKPQVSIKLKVTKRF